MKPKITLKIEETDSGLKPEQCAQVLLRGMSMGHLRKGISNISAQVSRVATSIL